ARRISGAMKYPFEHVGTWFCVFCKTLVPLRVQWSESGYFMAPDILCASGGCALVTAELLPFYNQAGSDSLTAKEKKWYTMQVKW
ncbi:MAG: hypothetical protein PUB10_09450, partial [Clostridiales bacterium]|nr:hypothetical protein [Clostridiales bacterium]